ncbi:uncharacterized protein B0H18DRAFT_829088, partial [Fomitopsis serialis]|uniref:uncharacterized protein n=1 Tax=Fomitopsis serialis TaxID=139415 RepID=UPI0020088C35
TSDLSKELSVLWHAMSKEEQAEATQEAVKELGAKRANRKYGTHNNDVASYSDTRASLSVQKGDLEALKCRTTTDSILFAFRGSPDSPSMPFVTSTTPRAAEFIELVTGMSVMEFVVRMEAHNISGVKGVTANYKEVTQNIKKQLSKLVLEKLNAAIDPAHVTTMNYHSFRAQIGDPNHTIMFGWPTGIPFACPTDIGNRNNLKIVVAALENGVAGFRKLNDSEWK